MTVPKTKTGAAPKRNTRSSGHSGPSGSSGALPPRSSRATLVMIVLIGLVLSFAGGFFLNHLIPDLSSLPQLIPEDRAQPDHSSLPAVSDNPSPARPPEPEIKPEPEPNNTHSDQEQESTQRMMGMQKTLTSLEVDFEALNTALMRVTERLDRIETTLDQAPAQAATPRDWSVLIAINHIRQSLQNGQPYAEDLAILTALVTNDPQATHFLEALHPYAESGLPSRSELSQRFIAQAALWAEAPETGTPQEPAGIWDNTIQRLKALVKIRRTGEQDGNTTEARVARAERQLNAHNLEAAGRELLPIPAARFWASQAIGRAKAEKALRDLTIRAMDDQ